MSFSIQQVRIGRRVGQRCVVPAPTNLREHTCVQLLGHAVRLTRHGAPGANNFRIGERTGGHKLFPGPFLLIAIPTAAGNSGTPERATFRIVL